MVVAIVALIAALAGTAYAAQTINGGAIKKQTIGGGKLKQKTLTGFQINTNKLGVVPSREARRPHLLGGRQQPDAAPATRRLARASDAGITATEGGGAVTVVFPQNVSGCANVADRNNAGTTVPAPATRRPTPRPPTRTRSKSAPATRKAPTRTPTST